MWSTLVTNRSMRDEHFFSLLYMSLILPCIIIVLSYSSDRLEKGEKMVAEAKSEASALEAELMELTWLEQVRYIFV